MMTRREAVRLLGAAAWFATAHTRLGFASRPKASAPSEDGTPPLAPGAPTSTERLALIETFKEKSAGLEKLYEARAYKSDLKMPYRLFRPTASGNLPLVVYLHGSGGLGDDNEKQLQFGNVFGTRIFLLPENQKRFPCYVLVPQTNTGWVHYDLSQEAEGKVGLLPGLGDGARLALEIIAFLTREFSIDERRIYVTGQSMGGAGVWHMTAQRPRLFGAAVACCGSQADEPATASLGTPLWNFHGANDPSVPVALSRDRIAALRKAGGHPLYTEYAGVDHNVWQWAYTEPELLKWVFAQKRAA
jgi:predicted peptidase